MEVRIVRSRTQSQLNAATGTLPVLAARTQTHLEPVHEEACILAGG